LIGCDQASRPTSSPTLFLTVLSRTPSIAGKQISSLFSHTPSFLGHFYFLSKRRNAYPLKLSSNHPPFLKVSMTFCLPNIFKTTDKVYNFIICCAELYTIDFVCFGLQIGKLMPSTPFDFFISILMSITGL
jgi:hypothetical protein